MNNNNNTNNDNNNEIKTGSVVRLNSGGPEMTVTSLSGNYICCSYITNGRSYSITIPPVCVTLLSKNKTN